jgi:FMN reductase
VLRLPIVRRMTTFAFSGSPSQPSRSAWLLHQAALRTGAPVRTVHLRDLPPAPLLAADAEAPGIRDAVRALATAELVLLATPIYKAAYSGLLKLFLDLLPPDALRGKTVLPLATGGSAAHLLALDYALKPVLSALGARHVLDAVFATDAQLLRHEAGGYVPEADLVARLDRAVAPLAPHRAAEPLASC